MGFEITDERWQEVLGKEIYPAKKRMLRSARQWRPLFVMRL
jgi:hypothetical protein